MKATPTPATTPINGASQRAGVHPEQTIGAPEQIPIPQVADGDWLKSYVQACTR